MYKSTLIFFATILIHSIAHAQLGSIQGKVMTSDHQPVEFVSISVAGTAKGSVTDRRGDYRINNLTPGIYRITASIIGLARQEKEVEVSGNSISTLNFFLEESATELSEIIVTDNRLNTYRADSSFIVAKLPLKDLENPQVYNFIGKRLLTDQVVTNLNDALKNGTGITRLWESTGRGGDGAEYYSMRGFAVQPTMVNGMPGISNGSYDPANLESIEVLKGPSGTLFGSSVISYGGLINITTKKPFDHFGGEVGVVSGSNGLNRVTADVNVPLNEITSTRLNVAYNTQNSFQDAGFSNSLLIAPSFRISPTERLTFLVNTEFLSRESAIAPMIFLSRYSPLSFDSMDPFEKNYTNSFTGNELTIRNPTYNLQAQAIYKLSDTWSSQTVVSRSSAKTNGYYHYLWDFADGDTFGRYISLRNGQTVTTDIQQNFLGNFSIGKFNNRLVAGVDYFQMNILNSSTGWVANGEVTLSNSEDTGILTKAGVDNLLADSFEGNSNGQSEAISAYVSDVITLSPKVFAMASVRFDRFEGKTAYWVEEEVESQSAISPKFGLVYQPFKETLSLFANYQNGFVNVPPSEVSDQDGSNPRLQTFEPEQANQVEFGAKSSLYDGRLSLSISYYDILVKNRVMTDPENVNNSIQGGEVESKGLEISLTANPVDGLNIIGGYSKNQSEVVKDNPGDGYIGLRPEEAGPELLINLWINYVIPSGRLKGLGFGFGGNSASEHKTLNRANTGTFTLPAYTVLNASVSYSSLHYSLILRVNNLADTKYFSGWSTVTPQYLRNVSLGLSYKF